MHLKLLPLLHIQRDLHAIPRGEARFRAYLATMMDGTDDIVLPITGKNPMSKDHVAALLDELLAADAEAIAAAAVTRPQRAWRASQAAERSPWWSSTTRRAPGRIAILPINAWPPQRLI